MIEKYFIVKIKQHSLHEIEETIKAIRLFDGVSLTSAKIRIDITESDLDDLREGKTFDWTFRGVDIHLYNPDAEEDET